MNYIKCKCILKCRIKDNQVDLYKDESIRRVVLFEYLKSSAEEGYVEAMHELGNAYMEGKICKRDYLKALAWHRQACRNGYVLSYV
jgi:TPR repeat protein